MPKAEARLWGLGEKCLAIRDLFIPRRDPIPHPQLSSIPQQPSHIIEGKMGHRTLPSPLAPLSQEESRNIENNIGLLSLYPGGLKENFGDGAAFHAFGDIIEQSGTDNHLSREIVQLLGSKKFEDVHELKNEIRRLFHSANPDATETLIFPDELEKLVRKDLNEKYPIGRTFNPIFPNGFIDDLVYADLANQGHILLADPHDLFLHLGSYHDTKLRNRLQKYMRLNWEGFDSVGRKEYRQFLENESPYLKGISQSMKQLFKEVRDHTHENWSYVTQEGLNIQGNVPFNGLLSLRKTTPKPDEALEYFLEPDVPFAKMSSLPGVDEFLKMNQDLANKVKTIAKPYEKYGDQYLKYLKDLRDEVSKTNLSHAEKMKWVAKKIKTDYDLGRPDLRLFFDQKEKETLMDLYLDFHQRYQNFVKKKYPRPADSHFTIPTLQLPQGWKGNVQSEVKTILNQSKIPYSAFNQLKTEPKIRLMNLLKNHPEDPKVAKVFQLQLSRQMEKTGQASVAIEEWIKNTPEPILLKTMKYLDIEKDIANIFFGCLHPKKVAVLSLFIESNCYAGYDFLPFFSRLPENFQEGGIGQYFH